MTKIFQNQRLKQIENWMDTDVNHSNSGNRIIRLTNWYCFGDNNIRQELAKVE